MPAVSVVIPTYNRAHLVKQAIASVLQQTFHDFEIIVVDDGSTDNTRQLIESIADPRIIYLYQENQGPGGTRNTGIKASQGRYVAFLDSDDLYLPEKLEEEFNKLEVNPDLDLVAGGYRWIDKEGQIIREVSTWQHHPKLDVQTLLFNCPFPSNNVMVRREWLMKVGGYDPTLWAAQDYDLWLRLAYAGCRMAWVEKILFSARIHAGNKTVDGQRHRDGMIAMMNKFFSNPDLEPELRLMENVVKANTYLKAASREYGATQFDEAKQDVARAVELNPELLNHRGQTIFEQLTAWAKWPLNQDPLQYIKDTFDHLPNSTGRLQTRKREAISAVAMATFFDSAHKQNWQTVRQVAVPGLLNNPTWLFNRGVLSILFKSIFKSNFRNGTHKS